MTKIYFIDSSGRKRSGKKYLCKYCGIDFIDRINRHRVFCSVKCNILHKQKNTKLIQLICYWCKKEFFRNPSSLSNSKSGLYFCNRKCKEIAQSLDGDVKEIQPQHYKNGKYSYRTKFSKKELFCHICGYNKFSCAIDIHHIDGNRLNNKKENLIPLCANCHRALHNNLINITEP